MSPRGSSLWPGIHRCPEESSSCLPGQVGCWAVPPQCPTLAQRPISNLPPSRALLVATCLPVRRAGFYSCPLPQPLLCSMPGLAALQSSTGCSAPPFQPPSFGACRAARRRHEGCNELNSAFRWWSLSRLQGWMCAYTLCLESWSRGSLSSLSARMGMGTVWASALAGRALEPVANAASGSLPPSRSCKVPNGAELTKQLPLAPNPVSELASPL